jgi:hypothetical protein
VGVRQKVAGGTEVVAAADSGEGGDPEQDQDRGAP